MEEVTWYRSKHPKAEDEPPPQTNYETAPAPYPKDPTSEDGKRPIEIYNLQICTCGHDRRVHSDFLGGGDERVVITNCEHAGACLRCECKRFVFSEALTGEEGKERRELERSFAAKLNRPVPPKAVLKKIPKKQ